MVIIKLRPDSLILYAICPVPHANTKEFFYAKRT